MSVAHGRQILVSRATWELVSDRFEPGYAFTAAGQAQLKGLERAEELFQVVGPGLPHTFPGGPGAPACGLAPSADDAPRP